MGIKERREREKQERINLILETTKNLILEKGFYNTSMGEISKCSELSIGSIYWYFKNKDEIIVSLLFAGITFMNDGLDKILHDSSTGHVKLKKVWDFFSQLLQQCPEYFYVFTFLHHPGALSNVSEEVKTQLRQDSVDNFKKFEKILKIAVPSKISANKLHVLADTLWSTFVGVVILENSRINLQAKSRMTSDYLETVFELLIQKNL